MRREKGAGLRGGGHGKGAEVRMEGRKRGGRALGRPSSPKRGVGGGAYSLFVAFSRCLSSVPGSCCFEERALVLPESSHENKHDVKTERLQVPL